MGPYYAFIHAHKVMLFGDPSLRLGGLQQRWAQHAGHLDVELINEAVEAGAAPDPARAPEMATYTARPNWGRYPIIFRAN